MKWKHWPDEASQISTDAHYGVYRGQRGEWAAWQRCPMKRIDHEEYANEAEAQTACEQHAKGREDGRERNAGNAT